MNSFSGSNCVDEATPDDLIDETTQIYEGTNQIQRVVMARNLLK